VWEANRKVFLYPENWIQPSLRDDKSPIYLQLESELMQEDLSAATILDVMKSKSSLSLRLRCSWSRIALIHRFE
jgi:hypothetical protein